MEGRDRYREVGQIPMRVKRKLVNQSDPSLKFFFFLTSKLDEFVRRFVSIRMKYFILFFFHFITSSRRFFFFFVTMVVFISLKTILQYIGIIICLYYLKIDLR